MTRDKRRDTDEINVTAHSVKASMNHTRKGGVNREVGLFMPASILALIFLHYYTGCRAAR